MEKILQQLQEVSFFKDFYDESNAQVSAASAGWHIEHLLLVFTSILEGLKKSDSGQYAPRFNIFKLLIMATGHISRNRGKAPKFTLPQQLDAQGVEDKIERVRQQLSELQHLHPRAHIHHPYFGHLNVSESLRFLYIHTHHHLKIIRDILK